MANRTLRVFINNQFYKEIVVETIEGTMSYNPSPIIEQIIADRDAGLLDQFNLTPGSLPLRIELPKQ
jgi:hypothetical protein